MRKIFFKGRFIFIPIAVAAFLSLISYAVMQLWNALLPDILHVATITFWQAMGIFVLCKILFGFGRGKGGGWGNKGPWMRHRMEERFKNMTPEERERFKQKFKERCDWGGHRSRFGHHGFETDWMNFDEAQEAGNAKKPTEE